MTLVYDFRAKRAIKKRGHRKDRDSISGKQQKITGFVVPFEGKPRGAASPACRGNAPCPPASEEVINI